MKHIKPLSILLFGLLTLHTWAQPPKVFNSNGATEYFPQRNTTLWKDANFHTQALSSGSYDIRVTVTPKHLVTGVDLSWKTSNGTQTNSLRDINPSNDKVVNVANAVLNGPLERTDLEVTIINTKEIPVCTEFTIAVELFDAIGRRVGNMNKALRIIDMPLPTESPLWTQTEADNVWNSWDLMMKDDPLDVGEEPNSRSENVMFSNDLWVRWYADGGMTHQNPKYSYGNNSWNRVYTTVRNRGCNTSDGGVLRLYWTAARTNELWREHWLNYSSNSTVAGNNWTYFGNDPMQPPYPLGGEITLNTLLTPMSSYNYAAASKPAPITPLAGGEARVMSPVGWRAPNPDAFKGTADLQIRSDGWPVLCLLSRIESNNDPMIQELDRGVWWNVFENNNIVTRNTFVANNDLTYDRLVPNTPVGSNPNYESRMGVLYINNPEPTAQIIQLSLTELPNSNPEFNDYATTYLAFDSDLWDIWDDGGRSGSGISVVSNGLVEVTDPNTATLTNIALDPYEEHRLGVMFEYYRDTVPDTNYTYGFSLGEYDTDPTEHINTPSLFITTVLDSPELDTDTTSYKRIANSIRAAHDETPIKVQLAPNPVVQQMTIHMELDQDAIVSVKFFDLTGRFMMMYASNSALEKGKNQLTIDTSELPKGTYICEVHANGKLSTQKFMKE